MKPHISMITLGVADLQRALHFYCEGLGLVPGQEKEGAVFFPLDGTWLVLWSAEKLAAEAQVPAGGSGFGQVALACNVAEKADVAKVLCAAKNAGGRITKSAQEMSWGGYAGYVTDPDGHLWEIVWNPKWRK